MKKITSSPNKKQYSTDKIVVRTHHSKSLSKVIINSPSPTRKNKNSKPQVLELSIIKQKTKKKLKQKIKQKPKGKQQSKNKQNLKNKKKTNFMTCLKQLKPINLQKQKDLFFKNNFDQNPFFVYPNISDIMDDQYKDNLKYDNAHKDYLHLARRILDKGVQLHFFDLVKSGQHLTIQQTKTIFNQYIQSLAINDVLSCQFLQNTISNTSVVHNNVESISTVVIGLPIRYTKFTIQGVMNHQIGTHFLRKFNDKNQKWFKQRKKYGLEHYLQTEEGLAAINQLLPAVLEGYFPPLLYRAAMLYLGCYLASQVSFCQLFKILQKYQPDPQLRWKQCVRVKRGVADTSKPGGMYKDQIYFIGAINILTNRHRINFIQLHCGKISLQDCLRLSEKGHINMNEKIKLPYFLQNMKLYMKCLDQIAEINQIK